MGMDAIAASAWSGVPNPPVVAFPAYGRSKV